MLTLVGIEANSEHLVEWHGSESGSFDKLNADTTSGYTVSKCTPGTDNFAHHQTQYWCSMSTDFSVCGLERTRLAAIAVFHVHAERADLGVSATASSIAHRLHSSLQLHV